METPPHEQNHTHEGQLIDILIARFVPIVGILLFVTGLGYLIYTSVWDAMNQTMRLTLGFFVSLVLIGTGYSFADRLRYFSDLIIGGGILLFYGSLMYGSRATAGSHALIPEIATLFAAIISTLIIGYIAWHRNSKVILILGMLGAYFTPLVIAQNDAWAPNMSFNAYFIYYIAINVAIFFLGKKISVVDLISLNILGLFTGTFFLHTAYDNASGILAYPNITFTLLVILVVAIIASIIYSSLYFQSKTGKFLLAVGYLTPLYWFFLNNSLLDGHLETWVQVIGFLAIAFVYFSAWYSFNKNIEKQPLHIAAYVVGCIALISVFFALFPDYNMYSGILIAYIGLIFSLIYIFIGKYNERLMASVLFTFCGAAMTLVSIYSYGEGGNFPTIFSLVSLVPALLIYPITCRAGFQAEINKPLFLYSQIALVLMSMILIAKFIETLDLAFLFFILPGTLLVLAAYFGFFEKTQKAIMMRAGVILVGLGFFSTFFYLFSGLIPGAADDNFLFLTKSIEQSHTSYALGWKHQNQNWHILKAIFAIIAFFVALSVSRSIQQESNTSRPSFLLVIIGYASVLLLVNFLIILTMNQLSIIQEVGGFRAIITTLWWVILAVWMIIIGIRKGYLYQSEKLLGLLLLVLTILKILIYDMATMDMQKKIIVLMISGGFLLAFSYFLQIKGYLKTPGESETTQGS